jgi:FKBP-type peptidyl-prolyl cis-trans isomerase
MKNRDRIIIIFLVGVMLFSALATGLLLIIDQSKEGENVADQTSQTEDPAAQQEQCVASDEAKSNKGNAVGPWPYVTEATDELKSEDLRQGDGKEVALNDCIVVHYRLALADGTAVEGNDTFAEGVPIEFDLIEGKLIEGWTKGIPGMKVGGVRRLTVPAELGYGEAERPGIPANSTLVFEVEVVEAK